MLEKKIIFILNIVECIEQKIRVKNDGKSYDSNYQMYSKIKSNKSHWKILYENKQQICVLFFSNI